MSNHKRSTADIMLEEYFSFLLADEEDLFNGIIDREKNTSKPFTIEQLSNKETELKLTVATKSSAIETKADRLIYDEITLWSDNVQNALDSHKILKSQPLPQSFELELKEYAEPEAKLEKVQKLLEEYTAKNLITIKDELSEPVSALAVIRGLTEDKKLQLLMKLATTPERKLKLTEYLRREQQKYTTPIKTPVSIKSEELTNTELESTWTNINYGEQFQVLYFIINGVKFAAPLLELGMIQLLEQLHDAVWCPKWILGLMPQLKEGDEIKNIEVVDTARWAMSEQLNDDISHREKYQYIMRLKQSRWGLAIDDLIGSSAISREQVNWRSKAGKRPWLAGIIKEQMCVLLHVDAMIEMFEQGITVAEADQKKSELELNKRNLKK